MNLYQSMEPKRLIVAVEATAAVGPFWQTIVSDYLDKIIRCFCGNGNEGTGQKPTTTYVELSLVIFSAHGSYNGCLVQRSGWTRDMNIFFQWLSAIPFAGGCFNYVAIAEGLAEALMMFSFPNGNQNQNAEGQRHCILVAASNPYPLPTPVYRPQPQYPVKSENIETQPDNGLSDVETLAKFFAQFAISLSVICPKQFPELRGIYNAGKRNPQTADPPVDNVRNPHFLVLISENFVEALISLSPSGMTSFQNMSSGSGASGMPSGTGVMVPTPVMFQQGRPAMQPVSANSNNSVTNMPLNQQTCTSQSARSKYAKVWEGNLFGLRQGQPTLITRLEAYRSVSASETLAANWPPAMQILHLISEDHMRNKQYAGKADFLVFRAMIHHGFLQQMQERKLCAVIQLPSQTLLLSSDSSKMNRLIAMLLPGDMVVYKPQIPNQLQQQQAQSQQQHQNLQQMQQQFTDLNIWEI